MLLIVSGPSGVGKNRWIDLATEKLGASPLIPYTTREPRASEEPDQDYHFITRDEFRDRIKSAFFTDWDFTLSNYYGSGPELATAVDDNDRAVIHALARMAVRLKSRFPSVRLLFLEATDMEELDGRLRARGCGEEELSARAQHWREEREHRSLFDRVIEQAQALCDEEILAILHEEFDNN